MKTQSYTRTSNSYNEFQLAIIFVNHLPQLYFTMKFLFCTLALLSFTAYFLLDPSPSSLLLYADWKIQYNQHFSPEQDSFRFGIFQQTLQKITEHNSLTNQTYKMGLNQFSALTHQQLQAYYLGYLGHSHSETPSLFQDSDFQEKEINWKNKGYVTGIKDQGQCGSCWAFSSTGALEALAKKKTGILSSFSEQQLMDCSRFYGNQGCNGGLMDQTFKYTKAHGITHQSDYPYKGRYQTCKTFTPSFKNAGHVNIKGCQELYSALIDTPISISVDANDWFHYSSGIFNNCGTKLDHGVLLVGATGKYWLVKNSWGQGWGQRGYIRLTRGNTCGICNQASYPI